MFLLTSWKGTSLWCLALILLSHNLTYGIYDIKKPIRFFNSVYDILININTEYIEGGAL